MKRITCKKCRRRGESLCGRAKCALTRKPYPPGIHGKGKQKRRREVSEFGRQLAQKQRIRFLYGLSEQQFARLVQKVLKRVGEDSGAVLFRYLETRLDNVLFRLGLARTLSAARLLIVHGHAQVNGKKVTRPSFTVRPGQQVALRPSMPLTPLSEEEKAAMPRSIPSWLSRAHDERSGRIEQLPDVAKEDRLRFLDARGIIDYYAR